VPESIGAGGGNRTLVFSLEGCCSTIELHPRGRNRVDPSVARRSTNTPGKRPQHPRGERAIAPDLALRNRLVASRKP
jgi:hypothetical protein